MRRATQIACFLRDNLAFVTFILQILKHPQILVDVSVNFKPQDQVFCRVHPWGSFRPEAEGNQQFKMFIASFSKGSWLLCLLAFNSVPWRVGRGNRQERYKPHQGRPCGRPLFYKQLCARALHCLEVQQSCRYTACLHSSEAIMKPPSFSSHCGCSSDNHTTYGTS